MLNASHRIAYDWEKNWKKVTKCTNNWISVSRSSSPKIILKRKYPKRAHIRFWTSINAAGMHFSSFVGCLFFRLLSSWCCYCIFCLTFRLSVDYSSRLHGHTLLTFFPFFSYDCWIMRANLADRDSPFRVFICVADLLLAAIFHSLSLLSPSQDVVCIDVQYMCIADFVCLLREILEARIWFRYLFIYLFGARSMMCKSSFLILFFFVRSHSLHLSSSLS